MDTQIYIKGWILGDGEEPGVRNKAKIFLPQNKVEGQNEPMKVVI